MYICFQIKIFGITEVHVYIKYIIKYIFRIINVKKVFKNIGQEYSYMIDTLRNE